MHRSSSTKPLSSSISQPYPISNTPPVNEICSAPLPNYTSRIFPHKNLSPNHLHYLPLHISIILLYLMTIIVTIPLTISHPQCMAINENLSSYSTTN